MPNKKDALAFFVTKIEPVSDQTKNLNEFASLYQGQSYVNKTKDLQGLFLNLEEVYKKYLKSECNLNRISIKPNPQGIIANDFKGKLFLS